MKSALRTNRPHWSAPVPGRSNVQQPGGSEPVRGAAHSQTCCARGRARSRHLAAFTLAEVLAALLFMAIVIPVAVEGLHIASRAGTVAERKGEAARVAERILNENLVTTNWNQSAQSGTVTEGARQFHWTMHTDPWTQDPNQNVLRQLTVEVDYTAQGGTYSVKMSTLVDSSQQY